MNNLRNNLLSISFLLSVGLLIACALLVEPWKENRPLPLPPSMLNSPFQVDIASYNQTTGDIDGKITNSSSVTIEVAPLDEFFLYLCDYQNTWYQPRRCTRCGENPLQARQPFIVKPNQTVNLDLVWVVGNHIKLRNNSKMLMGASYRFLADGEKSDDVYVMYSNKFQLGTLFNEPIWTQVETSESEMVKISILNNYAESIWIRPVCSLKTRTEQIGIIPSFGEYPHAALERRTDWGSWQVIRPDRSDCVEMIEPVEIWPTTSCVELLPGLHIDLASIGISYQSKQTVELWQGLDFDWRSLEPGWYRWHIVYFINGPELEFTGDHHIFTREFRIK